MTNNSRGNFLFSKLHNGALTSNIPLLGGGGVLITLSNTSKYVLWFQEICDSINGTKNTKI